MDLRDTRFPQKEMTEPVLFDLLETLGFMVMEPSSDNRLRVLGRIPSWFTATFGSEAFDNNEIVLENISPFVDHFGPLAHQHWTDSSLGILKSGPWVETDSDGREINLELLALNLNGKPTLLLQLLGQEYFEKRELLQRFREKGLDYEILFKTQRALRLAHDLLLVKQRKLKEDLAAASEIQRRFLPRDIPKIRNVKIAFKFRPCSSIAGDMFNVVELDDHNIGLYLFDVSGHGAPAAMMAVSVSQVLQPHSGFIIRNQTGQSNKTKVISPREVMDNLDLEFPMERFDKYFTIFYGILNCNDNILTYSSAGHPFPLIVRGDGSLDFMDKGGTIIGLGGMIPFEQGEKHLERGDKIILYSDGLTEFENAQKECFGMDRLKKVLISHYDRPVDQLLDYVQASLVDFAGHSKPQDDISLLGLEITG